ncbi:unnamed protein product [Nezara viridula]|uniref:Uncharacterized protein n=1 Tax=Nezara viridula TaxID=85310 RepID=A0A9P0HTN2_NEZVI|nr:unnamed protein product [Nezara viridula]
MLLVPSLISPTLTTALCIRGQIEANHALLPMICLLYMEEALRAPLLRRVKADLHLLPAPIGWLLITGPRGIHFDSWTSGGHAPPMVAWDKNQDVPQ